MAITADEILASKMAAYAANPNLAPYLTSESQVAMFRQLAYIDAQEIANREQTIEAIYAELLILAQQILRGRTWTVARAKEFRYVTDEMRHATYIAVDGTPFTWTEEGDNLVTLATVRESFNIATLCLAKGLPGAYEPLSDAELISFNDYLIDYLRSCGEALLPAISLPPDEVQTAGIIYYDAAYNGETVRAQVQTAVQTYLGVGMSEDGIIDIELAKNAVQAIPAVKTLSGFTLLAKAAADPGLQNVTSEYQTTSGYATLTSDASSWTMRARY